MRERFQLTIKGVVQGVGFRPFIYRLATQEKLAGFVLNDSLGVKVEIEGEKNRIKNFLKRLKKEAPFASCIEEIKKESIPPKGEEKFEIKESIEEKEKFVFIPYDLSICPDCLRELFSSYDYRYLYPFINCTNCGPRYTIIKDIPYDRKNTTMAKFKMCKTCYEEYSDPLNRRFHAQPCACFLCGPSLDLVKDRYRKPKKLTKKATEELFKKAAYLLNEGKILAIKGIGGYHIACDAKNIKSVKLLRERKNRPTKPFALMVDDLNIVKRLCYLSKKEEEVLSSARAPILLLKIKKRCAWMNEVAPHQKFLGIMLAYTPLHYLLFFYLRKLQKEPILVMTSANLKDTAIAKDEKEVFKLKKIVDYFLIHNRPIYSRCDDSVVIVVKNKEYLIRKARGYVPDFFKFNTPYQILGCGAQLKATFSIVKNNYLISSPYLGDLKNYANYKFYLETFNHFKKIFDFEPSIVAFDLHPGYFSTQFALSFKDKKKISVQHHHAHLASCMIENNFLNEDVIGIIFDGVGLGLDRNIWGGEFLVGNLKTFKRVGFFNYFGLPGFEKAIEQPYRVAFDILYRIFKEKVFSLNLEFIKERVALLKKIKRIIQSGNFVLTSSVGRIFDALAALLGIKDKISYEAEAAVLLEMCAYDCRERKVIPYSFCIIEEKDILKIDWKPFWEEVIKDMYDRKEKAYIAFRFHYSLACLSKSVCVKIRKKYKLDKVILSGGVFQNRLLLRLTEKELKNEGFEVFKHSRFPCNDASISLGQIAVASRNV